MRGWGFRFLELLAVALVFRVLAAAVALAAWQGGDHLWLVAWLPPADWLGVASNTAGILVGVLLYMAAHAGTRALLKRRS